VPLNLTLSGTGSDATAVFNATNGSFGINSAGADQTARFEDALSETITFTFDQNIELDFAEFDNLNNDEVVTVTAGATTFSIDDANSPGSDIFDFLGTPVAANTPITFSLSSVDPNNGVGIQTLTIHVEDPNVIPEPSSLAVLGLAGLVAIRRRRR